MNASILQAMPAEAVNRPKAQVRRVVTGINHDGASTVLTDEWCPHTMALHGIPTFRLTELWKTAEMPVSVADESDRCGVPIELAPLPNGTTLRFLEFPPDADWKGRADGAHAFSAMGESGSASLDRGSPKHEMMHRTQTLDYIIVLKGEIWAVFEDKETCLKAGDVLIQRGTNHAWSVRTPEPCLVIAVLIDAT